MHSAEYWIEHLNLQPHPEGGFYRETYKARETIAQAHLSPRFSGDRLFGSAIYFLIDHRHFSAFHRLAADEIWHFYAGSSLILWVINPQGELSTLHLGPKPEQGQTFQAVVPAGHWFAASVEEGYALVGCTMAPGFDFADFELAERSELLAQYPQHRALIERLTRPG